MAAIRHPSTTWPMLPRGLCPPCASEPEEAWLQALLPAAGRPVRSSTKEDRPLRTTEGIPAKLLRAGHGKTPRSKGGKNPPIPPIAPTSPVTVARLGREISRHELKYCAIADAEQGGASECANRERQHRLHTQQQSKSSHGGQNPRKNSRSANAVRQPSTERAAERSEHDESGGSETGVRGS